MASLWKRQNTKYWWACFTDREGRQRKRSTKTTDRKLALRLAEQFEEAARKRRTARQAREVIGDLHRQLTGEELPGVTARAFFAGWLARKRPEAAPASYVFYAKTADKFLGFLGAAADQDLSEVTRDQVTRWRNEAAQSLAPGTVNHDLKCLKMVFKAARRDGAVIEDPCEFVDTIRQKEETGAARRAFTLPELRAVLAAADAEWASMVRFGLYTGQRLADLAMLTWGNVDLARGTVHLSTRKTGRRMILPMAPALRKSIEGLPVPARPDAPLHPRAHAIVAAGKSSSGLSVQFADLLAAAGLRAKQSHQKAEGGMGREGRKASHSLSFHSLRKTATTLLHEAGIPAAVAQELIGHDSAAIHQVYVNVGREAMEKAAASLPEL